VLRRIFETRRETVTGERRKLHNEELHNEIKEDEMDEACSGHGIKKTNAHRILEGNRSLEVLRIILKLILKKWNLRVWSGFIWLKIRSS
jgi:hypothetical protein